MQRERGSERPENAGVREGENAESERARQWESERGKETQNGFWVSHTLHAGLKN